MRQRCLLILLVALVGLIGIGGSAGAVPSGPPGPKLTLRNVMVLEQDGDPFPAGDARLFVCPVGGACFPGSPDVLVGFADANGRIQGLVVDPTVRYRLRPFAGCGGAFLTFNAPAEVMGWELARPTTFVANEPCFRFNVLDGSGQPFPAGSAGLIVCPEGTVPCAAPQFGGANAAGVVSMALDPSMSYEINAFATTDGGHWDGWDCGGSEHPPSSGDLFWFSEFSTGTPATLEGTTFVINEPACWSFDVVVHYLDGTEAPLAEGYGAVYACTELDGCVVVYVDAAGHAIMDELDPTVTYWFTGIAENMPGWSCPTLENEAGQFWHANEPIIGTPDTASGTTFHIYEPDPTTCQ